MSETRRDLTELILLYTEFLSRSWTSFAVPSWPDVELSISQFRVLMMLQEGPKPIEEIAKWMGDTTGFNSAVRLKTLIERNMIRVTSDDAAGVKGQTHYALTHSGSSTVARMIAAQRSEVVDAMSQLKLEKLDQVFAGLETLLLALEQSSDTSKREH